MTIAAKAAIGGLTLILELERDLDPKLSKVLNVLKDYEASEAKENAPFNYTAMVNRLAKPGDDILQSLTADKCHLLHMVTGVSTEAGELGDAFKRHIFYGKELDRINVVEELGDLEFYLEGLRSSLGISREQVLASNVEKLSARYHQLTYSDAQAIARADKEGE